MCHEMHIPIDCLREHQLSKHAAVRWSVSLPRQMAGGKNVILRNIDQIVCAGFLTTAVKFFGGKFQNRWRGSVQLTNLQKGSSTVIELVLSIRQNITGFLRKARTVCQYLSVLGMQR